MAHSWKLGLAAVWFVGAFGCGAAPDKSQGQPDEQGSGGQAPSADTVTSSAASGAGSTGSGDMQCNSSAVNTSDKCEVCVVGHCTQQALACCEHKGCLGIIECAQKTGCTGADCYQPQTCKTAIDQAGGLDVALKYAQPLGDCALMSCKTECAVK